MTEYIIPAVGSTGVYAFGEPCRSFLNTDDIYECQGVRLISDYLSNHEDPFDLAYNTYGISKDTFTQDQADNIHIATLRSSVGLYYHIPCTYILAQPYLEGEVYSTAMMAINLGAMPVEYSYDLLEQAIHDTVFAYSGIVPETKVIELSARSVLDQATHTALQTMRSNNVTLRKPLQLQLAECQNALSEARNKIALLEQYIVQCVLKKNCDEEELPEEPPSSGTYVDISAELVTDIIFHSAPESSVCTDPIQMYIKGILPETSRYP